MRSAAAPHRAALETRRATQTTRFGAAYSLSKRLAFGDGHDPVRGDALESLHQSGRPAHLQIRSLRRPQSKMQARIVRRKEARLTRDLLGLLLPAVVTDHPGANGAPVRLRSHELQLQPVIAGA